MERGRDETRHERTRGTAPLAAVFARSRHSRICLLPTTLGRRARPWPWPWPCTSRRFRAGSASIQSARRCWLSGAGGREASRRQPESGRAPCPGMRAGRGGTRALGAGPAPRAPTSALDVGVTLLLCCPGRCRCHARGVASCARSPIRPSLVSSPCSSMAQCGWHCPSSISCRTNVQTLKKRT